MKSLVMITFIITLSNCLNIRQCNPAMCKGTAMECMESTECAKQLTSCLKDLRSHIAEDNSYESFETCLNKSFAAGKLLGCAKTQCPNSAAQFVTMIFNSAQSQSYISIDFKKSII
ncbi:unnamed protein product (macronuclear) [Paramecium tetraurelia]|uniref:Uncharacterized protein n=1 Tax=Paramecium tetraurelia TaxID=5888 RepID=A0C0J7_PARTE|nr:uncharacterized protein GSPATT00006167001 [Paramecium tetraurelia]CAK64314.1 unnamed protein product [Paramecium tetraurelia]|eukprot:XP_001431712.1 hypothetical protein (macronuclear) [Paramecium tetraurelia strain d4-2]